MADLDEAKKLLDPLLRKEEGVELKPYLCAAGVPTIAAGNTTYADGRKVKLTDPPITQAQCDRLIEIGITRYCDSVLEMVEGDCTTHQLVALVLCGYNIGLGALAGSSMIRLHKAGQFSAAARAFGLWNKMRAGGKGPLVESAALTARRAREAALYLTPDDDAPRRVPQAVAPEVHVARMPITQSGIATIGAGAVAALSQAGGSLPSVGASLQQAKTIAVDTLGIPAPWFLPLVLLAVGAVAAWQGLRQRQRGVA
jgi:lysozyme